MSEIVLGPGALDDPAIPDAFAVGLEGIKSIIGKKSRSSIYRKIEAGDIPPPAQTHPIEWTVGQLRDWRLRKSLEANERAWSTRAKIRARKGSSVEDVLASV